MIIKTYSQSVITVDTKWGQEQGPHSASYPPCLSLDCPAKLVTPVPMRYQSWIRTLLLRTSLFPGNFIMEVQPCTQLIRIKTFKLFFRCLKAGKLTLAEKHLNVCILCKILGLKFKMTFYYWVTAIPIHSPKTIQFTSMSLSETLKLSSWIYVKFWCIHWIKI